MNSKNFDDFTNLKIVFPPATIEQIKETNKIVSNYLSNEYFLEINKSIKLITQALPQIYPDSLIHNLNMINAPLKSMWERNQKIYNQLSELSSIANNFINNFNIDMSFESFQDISQELILEIEENIDDYSDVNQENYYSKDEDTSDFMNNIETTIKQANDDSLPSKVRTVATEMLIQFAIITLIRIIIYIFSGSIEFDLGKKIIQVIIEWINTLKITK